MPTRDKRSLRLEIVSALVEKKSVSQMSDHGRLGHLLWALEYPWPRSRSAMWGLEDNTVQYIQEKKLWVNMAVSIRHRPPVRLSHTTEA